MLAYILRRLLLIVPTTIGIVTLNFFIVQVAPGGPVEQFISQMRGGGGGIMERVTGQQTGDVQQAPTGGVDGGAGSAGDFRYRGAQGLNPEIIKEIEKMYGFDQPLYVRYFQLMWDFARFDLGKSFFRDRTVIDLVIEKLPVSISLGLWAMLIMYAVSIPLGIAKAVRHGSKFDVWSSTVVITGNAIPAFLFAILLVVLFAGGSYFKWFPLRGLTSTNFDELTTIQQILDYFWHITLPVLSLVVGSFASLTLLTKNSFLEEINKQYVVTARAKGLTERRVLYGHVFRNAMLIVVAGFPAAFIGMFFTGSLLIEVIFSLNGLGLMGYEALLQRDYPVIFGTLYIFTLIGLMTKIFTDLTYTLVDPRIDFEGRP